MKPEISRRPAVKLSVFSRCILLIAATVVAVAATVSVQSSGLVTRIAVSGVASKADVVNRFLSSQSAGGVRFGKGETVESVLTSAADLSAGMITGAVAVDRDGGIVASIIVATEESSRLTAAAREAIETGRTYTSADGLLRADPVLFGPEQEVIGAVASEWSPEIVLAEIARSKRTILLVATATLIVALVGGGVLLHQTLSAPIRRVGAAMKRVVSGDYSPTIPETGRNDEIGLIARDLEFFRGMISDASAATKSAIFQSAAFRASSAAMILTDTDFNVVLANAAFDEMARKNETEFQTIHPEFSANDLVGMNIDAFHAKAGLNRALLTDPDGRSMVADIRVGARIMSLGINGILDETDQVIGFVVEWADVTDIRRDTAVLKSLEAKQVRMQFDDAARLAHGNDLFSTLAGKDRATLIGVSASKMVAPVGSTFDAMEAQLRRGETVVGRFGLTLGGNPDILLDGAFCPIVDAEGRAAGTLLLGLDITEQERVLEDAERARTEMKIAQDRVVEALRAGLARLREGDLTFSLDDPLNREYEQLREDFNAASQGLHDAIVDVGGMAAAMRDEVQDIVSAADDLSRRTEQQAATLEETAAAVAQVTAAVSSASEGARRATEVVKEARGNAESSGAIVSEAVSAMDAISSSSDQISKIIGVIDDIAFQTNLLALNAGVEAARAGDAGRGFAVVASEVRALAQRSSEAAREISDLITTSGQHVKNGARLVGQAGDALRQIAASVTGISDHVTEIVSSSQEQSASLTEVNSAMGELDQVTQQNAAMFEETTAASHALVRQAEGLSAGIARFRVSGQARPRPAAPSRDKPSAAAVSTVASAVKAPLAKSPPVPRANGALALSVEQDDDWSDF